MKRKTLREIIKLNYGKSLPERDRKKGSYPVYGSSGNCGSHNSFLVTGPGIIIGRKGSIGTVYYEKNDFFPIDTVFYVETNINKYDIQYLYYLIKTSNLNLLNSDSAVPGLNRDVALTKEVNIYEDIKIQRKIANILRNYDDLIDNNSKRIKILEEMAQKIYKEWFIDFKFLGHEKAKFKQTTLGPIPENWYFETPNNLIIHSIGGGWGNDKKTNEFCNRAYVIRGTDIPELKTGKYNSCPIRYHKTSNIRTRIMQNDDIVLEVSGGSKGQPVGRPFILNHKITNALENQVICASFCKLLRINKDIISPYLFYMHLDNIYSNGEIMKYQLQSTGITNFKFTPFIENEYILIPSKSIQKEFMEMVLPIHNNIYALGIANQNLRQTRDLLLPKLISGEIDVEDLEVI